MTRRLFIPLALCCFLHGGGITHSIAKEGLAVEDENGIELSIGGVGGAYFLAEPGTLTIDLEKRDRNIHNRHTELRAILVGPDRRAIQEATIPADDHARGSGLGPTQRVQLSTQVERPGIYALNITVSQDRYGEDILWGFRTNCPRYLIETSRGHKDARHQEPIVLWDPTRPGDICFAPRQSSFEMEIDDLPANVDTLPVYDSTGALVHALTADEDGRASHRFPADIHRENVPWRLHLPVQQATIQIDGVTRWDREDLNPNLSYWTPDPASYFPFPTYRWMLTPYDRTVYSEPGDEGAIPFRVHNSSDRRQTFDLEIEFPDGPWPVQLSTDRVKIEAQKTAEVVLHYTAGPKNAARICHLRITPQDTPDVTTYSTLEVRTGAAPATHPLDMPLTFEPYRHENQQFGYLPDYPLGNQVYFDLENRPFFRTGRGLETLQNGNWIHTDLGEAVQSRIPPFTGNSFGMATNKVAFDRDNDLYLVTTTGSRGALLHSTDRGQTFTAYLLGPEDEPRGAFDIEQFSGHNLPDNPPPILRSIETAADENLIWRRISKLELLLPEKEDGRLSVGEPIFISANSLGVGSHSGIPSAVVSRGSKVHAIWAEATDPDDDVPGVPTYVVTYDREIKQLGTPALIGYGAPPNDVHNRPCISIDSQGYLHALAGTHGQPFQYARSLQPNDAGAGWTQPEDVGDQQTYIGLVCGPDDTLHLIFRMWRRNEEPFPNSHHATLAYQRKRPGEAWEPARVLVVAPFSEYSIFYHRFTIDQIGRLFLSYDYWSTFWFYRTDHRGDRRSLMMSPDGGENWKLVETRDFE
ncbi:MAG: hypothetical protein HOC74_34150 [Gemmatimonadetes bacterium]|jgi:hypothetical protein|nr:hypothetical protein [Gemmatimonadota bacterium]